MQDAAGAGGPDIDWAALLVDYRRSTGLKQSAAAQDFGVSQSTISRWEAGESRPGPEVRNVLYEAARRSRSPMSTRHWEEVFRRLVFPAIAIGPSLTVRGITEPLAAILGVPAHVLDGLPLDVAFEGECVDVAQTFVERGVFRGGVACIEAAHRVTLSSRIRRGAEHHAHYVAWPHFGDDGITIIQSGRVVSAEEAAEIRSGLGGVMCVTPL